MPVFKIYVYRPEKKQDHSLYTTFSYMCDKVVYRLWFCFFPLYIHTSYAHTGAALRGAARFFEARGEK